MKVHGNIFRVNLCENLQVKTCQLKIKRQLNMLSINHEVELVFSLSITLHNFNGSTSKQYWFLQINPDENQSSGM